MKQTITRFNRLPVAFCLLFMASCHNDEVSPEQSYIPQDGMIRVATAVANTRAGQTTENLSSFYLNIVHPTDSRYSYYANMKRGNNGWNSYMAISNSIPPELPMFWKNSHDKITVGAISIIGHFTLENDFNTLNIRFVNEDQYSSVHWVGSSDVLYMPPTEVDPATGKGLVDGKIKIELGHLFSKFSLNITMATEFNGSVGTATNPITNLTVNGTKTGVYFNASTNVWGDLYSDHKAIRPWYDKNSYLPGQGETGKAQASYECILIPQTVNPGIFAINFTLAGREFMWTPNSDLTFESGKQYNLSLKVGKDVTLIGDMSASDWENGTGGTIETE